MNQTNVPRGRTQFIFLFFIFGFSVLAYRLYSLQITDFEIYTNLSQKNQYRVQSFKAIRGKIFDRNGTILAFDAPEYTLQYSPNTSSTEDPTSLLTQNGLVSHQKPFNSEKKYTWKLSKNQTLNLSSHLHKYPTLSLKKTYRRNYRFNQYTAHLIGLYGRDDPNSLQQYPYYERSARMQIGKSGIEKDFESVLAGTPGIKRIHTDAKGHIKSDKIVFEAKSGKDIKLTIDIRLQQAAIDALAGHKGSLIAIQPRTGDILAIASSPTFDPQIFYDPKKSKELAKTIESKNQPMFNRAINGLYSPASTIKPILALGGLDAKVITANEKIFDPGYFYIPGSKHRFNNWRAQGQGHVDIVKAIQISCDTYFYNLAYRMGIEKIFNTLSAFGFGQSSGTFPNESAGYIPNLTNEKHNWHMGNTIITGIGQGKTLVTPLQLAQATAIISLNGKRIQPRIIMGIGSLGKITDPRPQSYKQPIVYDDKIWQTIRNGMKKALGPNGTGKLLSSFPRPIAGKTGTAQLVKIDKTKVLPQNLHDNSLLIAFSPIKNPEIAIALVVENENLSTILGQKFLDEWYKLTQNTASPSNLHLNKNPIKYQAL